MTRKSGLVVLALAVFVFINSACNLFGMKKKGWKPASPQKAHFVHTVKYSGETLRIISKWYTGDVKNWEVLANANPHIDYNKMMAGNNIFIPENLLKTRKPLTKKYMDSYYKKNKPKKKSKKKKPTSKTKTPPEKKDEFDLIGPK